MKLIESKLRELIRQAIKELDFKDKESFKKYQSSHKMRPSTKVNIGGKETTVGKADTDNGESEKGDLEDAHWNMDKWMPNERDLMDEFHYILNISNKSKRLKELISFLEDEAHEDILYKYLGKKSIKDLAKHIIKKEA